MAEEQLTDREGVKEDECGPEVAKAVIGEQTLRWGCS